MQQNTTILSRSSLSFTLSGLLVMGLFFGCDTKTQTQQDTSIDASAHTKSKERKVVATVNSIALYEDKLNAMVQKKINKDRRYRHTSKPTSAQINLLKQKILNRMINDEVLRQASLKEPVADLQQKIEMERASIEKKFGSKEAFNHYLTSMHMDALEFNNFLKEKIHLKEYFKKYNLNNPDIPEQDIRSFYEKGKQNFSRGKLVDVSQILLNLDNNTSEDKQNIFKKANDIRNRLLQGESFATLARQYSQSAEANETNGSLGFIKKGYMPKAFEEVAFSLHEGDISEPVLTSFGYHIIKVNKIEPARVAPYEEVRSFIKKYLQENIIVTNTLTHVKKLREKATIKFFTTTDS